MQRGGPAAEDGEEGEEEEEGAAEEPLLAVIERAYVLMFVMPLCGFLIRR